MGDVSLNWYLGTKEGRILAHVHISPPYLDRFNCFQEILEGLAILAVGFYLLKV